MRVRRTVPLAIGFAVVGVVTVAAAHYGLFDVLDPVMYALSVLGFVFFVVGVVTAVGSWFLARLFRRVGDDSQVDGDRRSWRGGVADWADALDDWRSVDSDGDLDADSDD